MSALSNKVLEISVDYLGPAAKVFYERQTKVHMNGLVFDELQQQHLKELSEWVYFSGKLVIEPPKAKELSDKVASL